MKQSLWFYLCKFILADLLTIILYLALFFIWGALIELIPLATLALIVLTSAIGALFAWLLVFITYARTGLGENREMKRTEPAPAGFFPRLRAMLAEEKPMLFLFCAFTLLDVILQLLKMAGLLTRAPLMFLYMGMSLHSTWLTVPVLSSVYGLFYTTVCYLFILSRYQNKWYRNWHHTSPHSTSN